MKRLFLVLPALIIALVFDACQKDDGDTTELTKTEMLTGHIWVSTAKTISPAININGASITNIMLLEPDCSKDNSVTFNVDSTFIISEEAVVCDPVTSIISDWRFNSNEAQLYFGDILTFNLGFATLQTNVININEITKDKLILSLDVSSQSTDYVIKLEFEPKE